MKGNKDSVVLISSVFLAGLCSIIYELLISTASSYFLGDSIRQFSITIGLYMAAMGGGSYLSRKIKDNLMGHFIQIEIILGLLGGLSIPILYLAYGYTQSYELIMAIVIILIGVLIGLEIPLLTRIMEHYYSLKVNISNVLSVDYVGSLLATLLFPFVLLPLLGTFRSSLFFGLVNMAIGFINLWCFKDRLSRGLRLRLILANIVATLCLLLVFVFSWSLITTWSNSLYRDPIVLSKETKYQSVIMTRKKDDLRMFINGNLQFSTVDEYRYHEALIHIPMGLLDHPRKVLILGGGDGLAVREILKYPSVDHIDLVDIDPEIVRLARSYPYLRAANEDSLSNPIVHVHNVDAFIFAKDHGEHQYDLIISDLPDPNNVSLGRMYSREFYRILHNSLAMYGVLVVQSTSPYHARKTFWTIHNSIQAGGFANVDSYHCYVPSFGDWGFNMAYNGPSRIHDIELKVPTKYLNDGVVAQVFQFGSDRNNIYDTISTLDDPKVVHSYHKEWLNWN
ncbi:polyamine aminopropyltransferase [Spirochaeta cellobiosiphila]|uniref:polyamine aminopropyltransferase n=1 Tax=Spirochaeta cellobiosiphila TaxID=504483 RepID=UPI00041B4206|nr:polyamine aminopropyltransferase [Spirochaeta cellobiosiphila]